jgi:hypothetical protein
MAYLVHTLTEVACFAVADIRKVVWNPESFSHLTIPQEKKDTLKGVAEVYTSRNLRPAFDDFIQGKGRGLITLLQSVFLWSGVVRC